MKFDMSDTEIVASAPRMRANIFIVTAQDLWDDIFILQFKPLWLFIKADICRAIFLTCRYRSIILAKLYFSMMLVIG